MLSYLRESFRRKRARRVTQEYSHHVDKFQLGNEGEVEFANWDNPLIKPLEIKQSTVDFFKQYINNGDLVIDIGANIGDTSVPMALAAGNDGCTLAFDPNPFVYKVLEVNARLNPDTTNIIPLNKAISSEEAEFYYVSSEASFGNGGISPTKESDHGKYVYPEKISGINLLDYLEEEYADQLESLSFIKIDTEGYDKEIIKSIYDLLNTYKPVIIAECFGPSSDEDKIELFDLISDLGYEMHRFEHFDVDTSTKAIETHEDMLSWDMTIDICATHEN